MKFQPLVEGRVPLLERWHDAYDEASRAGLAPDEAVALAELACAPRPGGIRPGPGTGHTPTNDYQVFAEADLLLGGAGTMVAQVRE